MKTNEIIELAKELETDLECIFEDLEEGTQYADFSWHFHINSWMVIIGGIIKLLEDNNDS